MSVVIGLHHYLPNYTILLISLLCTLVLWRCLALRRHTHEQLCKLTLLLTHTPPPISYTGDARGANTCMYVTGNVHAKMFVNILVRTVYTASLLVICPELVHLLMRSLCCALT